MVDNYLPASKYDQQKKVERQARLRRLDVSLWRAELTKSDTLCTCHSCQGRYYKLTWRNLNRNIWEGDKACLLRVMIHIHRINMLKNIRTPIDIFNKLRELAT